MTWGYSDDYIQRHGEFMDDVARELAAEFPRASEEIAIHTVDPQPLPTHHCLYCAAQLRFVLGRGWVHQDGEAYVGRCYCENERHTRLKEFGVMCPTWRDDHCALPRRS